MTAVRIVAAGHGPDGAAYWTVRAEDGHVVRTFHVLDRHDLTLSMIWGVASGPVNAGDRWCHTCGNRLRHDWRIVDGTVRCVCTKCGLHAPEDR